MYAVEVLEESARLVVGVGRGGGRRPVRQVVWVGIVSLPLELAAGCSAAGVIFEGIGYLLCYLIVLEAEG